LSETFHTMEFETQRRKYEASNLNWGSVTGMGTWTKQPYLVFELLPGRTLHQTLKSSQTCSSALSVSDKHIIVHQLAKACQYLASFGLIHRDLRACNIQICQLAPAPVVKVLDLGVTIVAAEHLRINSNPSVHVFNGFKPGYDWLPWETYNGKLNFEWPAHAFDMFSLGVLWLEIFAGKAQTRQLLARILQGAAVTRSCVSYIHRDAQNVVRQLLGPVSTRPSPQKVLQVLGPIMSISIDDKIDQSASNELTPDCISSVKKICMPRSRSPRKMLAPSREKWLRPSVMEQNCKLQAFSHQVPNSCQSKMTNQPMSKFGNLDDALVRLRKMVAEVTLMAECVSKEDKMPAFLSPENQATPLNKERHVSSRHQSAENDNSFRQKVCTLLIAVKQCEREAIACQRAEAGPIPFHQEVPSD